MARRRQTPRPPAAPPPAPRQEAATTPAAAPAGRLSESAAGLADEKGAPRRRVLVRLWALLGSAALGELAWVTGSFLRPRPRPVSAANLFVAGPADRFEPGSVTAFPSGSFYLVRLKDGGFLALHRECTHLGCTVPWDAAKNRFACPCHASAFDITGQVLNPPAPRPLDLYEIRIENGVVKVDTRQRQQRRSFEPSQVTVS